MLTSEENNWTWNNTIILFIRYVFALVNITCTIDRSSQLMSRWYNNTIELRKVMKQTETEQVMIMTNTNMCNNWNNMKLYHYFGAGGWGDVCCGQSKFSMKIDSTIHVYVNGIRNQEKKKESNPHTKIMENNFNYYRIHWNRLLSI